MSQDTSVQEGLTSNRKLKVFILWQDLPARLLNHSKSQGS